jgi:cytochrome P450
MTATSQLPARNPKFFDPATEVHFDPILDTWHAFSLADVIRVLTDSECFSSGYGLTDETRPFAFPALSGMWAADGERHRDLRAAVADPFRPRVLSQLETEIRILTGNLLDGLGERFDAVSELARPLPSQVVCRVLGLDISYAQRVHDWLDETYEVSLATNQLPQQKDQHDFFQELIDRRRVEPQDGLLDELITAQNNGYVVDGRPMTDGDLIGYCTMLLSAGVDTTSVSVGNALLFLTELGHWDELREDPSLIPGAVEETMRWYPAFPGVRRLVVKDTELGGHSIHAGQWATGWVSAANRDPERFIDPDKFDIRRSNRHLTLGTGLHHCLGAGLARLEQRVLLEEAVHRLPGLHRDLDAPLQRREWMVDSLEALHFVRA